MSGDGCTDQICVCVGEEHPHQEQLCDAIRTQAVRAFLEETEAAGQREHRDWTRLRSQLLPIMLSVAFAGGVLLGVLLSAFRVPVPFVAPLILGVTGLFWLLTLSRAGSR